ncbi:GGDEF domain-containing protein [Oleiagrimonas sp.]|uniref:sensor domain-containing protein n=1 Tax=Oleiagrimonas sp. TaxID=2010330 RepID=UPI00260CE238|nr:GGDEF domain-containing protein [Oleiagrimonas sp.]MDA3912972.1 diguanylate cyclase [Oleiagrimonas sp.]
MDNDRLARLIDLLLDPVCIVDPGNHFVFVNAAFERVFGYAPEEIIGRDMIELVHPDDRENTLETVALIMAGHPQPHFENRYVHKDGHVVHVMWSARWSETDQLRLAVARDISELMRARNLQDALYEISEAAHASEDLFSLYQHIHAIIGRLLLAENFFVALYDARENMLSFPYFVDAYDAPPPPLPFDSGTLSAELIRSGKPLLIHPGIPETPALAKLPGHGHDKLNWLGVPLNTKQGVIGAIVVQSYSETKSYSTKDMELLQFVSTQVAAAIERKQAETRLRHLARHDTLTDLVNRETFHDRLESALEYARAKEQSLAVIYVDLDGFKQVNDNYGHAVGDQLLRQAARRMVRCLRETDTVGRVGGDEFTILIEGLQRPALAEFVAKKIHTALTQPFKLSGHTIRVTPSIGIATSPEHGQEKKQLIHHADDAMYEAKRNGGNRIRMTTTTDDAGD